MKILILYANAGGGHKTMARVLESELKSTHEVQIIDVFAKSKNPFEKNLSSIYSFLTKEGSWLWYLFIKFLRQKWFEKLTSRIFFLTSKKLIREILQEQKPDMVISTYYFLTEVVSKLDPKIQTWCVVSDLFSPEKVWFSDLNCKYLVFSDQSKQIGLESGITKKNLIQIPPVILNPSLAAKKPITSNNSKQKTILLLGGGEGLKNAFEITQMLLEKPDYKVVVVCGRDQKMFNNLSLLAKNYSNLEIFGFVNFIPELIQKSDLVVSKAGPNSVLEILSLSKPIFLCNYIWPQEKGILDYVVENKYGVYQAKPLELVDRIETFLAKPEQFNFIKPNLEFGNSLLKKIF
jgi:UDP-N-acetylglucosamine:LPS N-acetylglucosamine transferase